jgi:methylmalonyl-CoA/ethylmalonyl-CoA epimerase
VTGDRGATHLAGAAAALPAGLAELRLDHVAIAVADLDAGSAPWLALGLARHGADEVVADQGVRVRAFVLGDALLEVLAPLGPDGAVARFLERRGPGLHHVALRVADLVSELRRLEGLGAELIDRAPRAGRAGTLVAFVHPRWTGGTLVELVEVRAAGAVGTTDA